MRNLTRAMLAGAALISAGAWAGTARAAYVTDALGTPFDGDIANDGVMFDLTVKQDLLLQSIGINADAGTFDYRVYYRAGGIAGGETDPSGWTLVGYAPDTFTAGAGNATVLSFAALALTAGDYGFYVTDTQNAFSVLYSDSAGSVGDVIAEDAFLAARVGLGAGWPFNDPRGPRAVNATFQYTTDPSAVPEPASWAAMIAGFAMVGAAARRRRVRVAFA